MKAESESHYSRDYPINYISPTSSEEHEADGRDGADGGLENTEPADRNKRQGFPCTWLAAFKKFDIRDKIASLALCVSSFAALVSASALIVAVAVYRENSAKTRLEQRAWLDVAEITIDKQFDLSKDMTFSAKVSNTGRTPAKKLRIKTATVLTDRFPLPKEWVMPPPEEADGLGTVSPGNYKMSNNDVSPSAVDKFRKEHPTVKAPIYLYFVGRISYEDVFGNPRWTDFCYYRHEGDSALIHTMILAPDRNDML